MASAAITIGETVATIESTTGEAVITKGLTHMTGTLVNGGTVKTFIKVNGTTVPTTDAQAQGVIGLAAGASMPILRHYTTLAHVTGGSTTVLYWFPNADKDHSG